MSLPLACIWLIFEDAGRAVRIGPADEFLGIGRPSPSGSASSAALPVLAVVPKFASRQISTAVNVVAETGAVAYPEPDAPSEATV